MYGLIALCSPPWANLTWQLLPEFPEDFWQPGLRLAVPLGNKNSPRLGILLEVKTEANLAKINCKNIIWPLEKEPLIAEDLLALANDLAIRQSVSSGYVFGHVLPQPLRNLKVRLCVFNKLNNLNNLEQDLTNLEVNDFESSNLESANFESDNLESKNLKQAKKSARQDFTLSQLAKLKEAERLNLATKFCQGQAQIVVQGQDLAELESCVLQVDPPWPVRPAAKRQIEILDFLLENPKISRRALLQKLGQNIANPLKNLIDAGYIAIQALENEVEILEQQLQPPVEQMQTWQLNSDQQTVLQDLLTALDSGQAHSRLLFGVTGSGKSAVYFSLAKECLARGKSLLLLAPEVALALKLYRDARHSMPDLPTFLSHGYQSPRQRELCFRQLATRKQACLVIGTRSALFYPLPNLACIILDEEHDASYKQDEGLAYHAREVAWFRTHKTRQGLLLLGSATPEIRIFYAAEQGKLPLLQMPKRVCDRPLPQVKLVNIAKQEKILAPEVELALKETVERGEQAVILLNRRGHTPILYCLECKTTLICPNCQIALTWHKARKAVICHYCGHLQEFPIPCPVCASSHFLPLGQGTEKLEEYLAHLTKSPILRLDRDNSRRQGSMENILTAFAKKEAQILVGTQMISKGHHFPLVTLVIVVDADFALNLPDYRASERTFQLLLQAAGRAGRGEIPGQVLIQTRYPQHYFWQYLLTADYQGFYREEIQRRKRYTWPPFTNLALLHITCENKEGNSFERVKTLINNLRPAASGKVRLMGPVEAPLTYLRGQYRCQCLMKSNSWQDIRNIFQLADTLKDNLHLNLDLDPVNML